MATLIRLTYSQTGKTTMVNFDLVETIYRVHDKPTGRFGTRINFANERYVIVEESLQDVLKLVQGYSQNKFQDADWVEDDVSYNIEHRMEESYNNHMGYGGENRRPRRYPNTYHNNRY